MPRIVPLCGVFDNDNFHNHGIFFIGCANTCTFAAYSTDLLLYRDISLPDKKSPTQVLLKTRMAGQVKLSRPTHGGQVMVLNF